VRALLNMIERLVPFVIGSVLFIWASGGPSIGAMLFIAYLGLFLGFMPSRGVILRAAYTLLFAAWPVPVYMLLAASIDLTLNAGFAPVFSNGVITPFGVWQIYSEYLLITGAAAVVHALVLLIKRWRTSAMKV
jgi:hypothetical protein